MSLRSISPALWLRVGAILLATAAGTLHAQQAPRVTPPPAAANDVVGPIELRDETIDQVLSLIERWTGKTALRPQALPATTLTLTLKGDVTREEAVRALETVLTLNGIAITSLDNRFFKVTPLANAKSEAPELIDGSTLGLPASGRIVSKIFQLNFLRVTELVPQITPLLNATNAPVIFEKANAMLLTDTLSNLQRVETLVARLDEPRLAGLEPKFYSLHYAKASEVVTRMHAILSGPLEGQIGTATTYNPDDRTNQIVLIADPRQHPFFDQLIEKLDVRSDPNTRNDVIYLKHASAKDVATILSQLVSGQNAASRTASPGSAPLGAAPLPAAAAPSPATPTPSPAPAASGAAAAALALAPQSSSQFSTLLTILAEERSNSLVVSGTVDDIRLIGELVAKLDVLLAQVRIEVVIAEVTLQDKATSGISELGLTIVNNRLVGFTGEGAGTSITNGTFDPLTHDLSAVVKLGTTPRKNNTTILSQPNIITTHNKEGKIFVGESVPTISSYINDGVSTGNTGTGYRSTVASQDIGIDLSVKPLIGPDGSVQLEIKQAVNDILGEVIIDGNPQPRIGKRTTESFVSARSGEIIVLAGLQRSSKARSTSRLGPIPLIGDLLGTRTREDTRTDLVFFLRPYVLTNTPADNLPALQQLERFPEKQREDVKRSLQETKADSTAGAKKAP